MRDHPDKQNLAPTIFLHEWAKQGTCPLLEIVRQLYLMVGHAETNLQLESPKLVPNITFHSQVHGGGAIPDWQGNHGLYSSRAIAILLPNDPATTFFLGAIFSLESQLGFLARLSRNETVMRIPRNVVFACTQS